MTALGFGVRIGGIGAGKPMSTGPLAGHGKPRKETKSTAFLEEMLKQAQAHYHKVFALLKVLPASMEEQIKLLDQESKLAELIKTLEKQIAARR